MKVLMVLTSHDQLGNTGRKDRLLVGGTRRAVLRIQGCRRPDHLGLPQGRSPTARMGLTKVVPFLVEDELIGLGATFSKVKNWGVHTVTDGQLITGQNPASSGPDCQTSDRDPEGEIAIRPGSDPAIPVSRPAARRGHRSHSLVGRRPKVFAVAA
jgi:hypothetical protein